MTCVDTASTGKTGVVIGVLERERYRAAGTPADRCRKRIRSGMKLVARHDRDLELSGREEPREAAQLAAVRSHIDARDRDPSVLFGRIRGDGREPTAVANRADRIPRTARCGVYGRGNTFAVGDRQNLIRPILLAVVDDIARSQRGDLCATVRARGRDYFRPAE